MCKEVLFAEITVDTSGDKLVFADTHNAQQLRAAAMSFVIQNISHIINTDKYKSMKLKHSLFGWEILENLVKKQ